jgi:opacity protein-like surface antigen
MPATAGSQERWNPAWAVMAGVSYSVTRQFLVDVGYRHLDLGDMTGGPVGALAIKRVTGDEIRVGFRYLID